MKKKYCLLLLLFPFFFFSYGQTQENTPKAGKFGVGVGYSLNTVFGDSIHPIEIVLKYRLKDKHTFYLNVPFQISRKHKDSSGEEYIAHNWERRNVYGVGAGYDYNIPIYAHLSGFIGLGFEYTHFKNEVSGSSNSTDKLPHELQSTAHWESSVSKNAYSLLPSVGLRYSIGHWEAEVKYKLYVSRIREDQTDYYIDEAMNTGYKLIPYPYYETAVTGAMSFYLTYFF